MRMFLGLDPPFFPQRFPIRWQLLLSHLLVIPHPGPTTHVTLSSFSEQAPLTYSTFQGVFCKPQQTLFVNVLIQFLPPFQDCTFILFSALPAGFPSNQWSRTRLPVQETWVPSLGWKEPLEEGVAAHSSILAGDPHGQSSPAGYSPWGHTESEQDLAHSKDLAHSQDLAHSNSGSSHSLSGPASKQANKAPPGQEVERSLEHSRPLMLLTPCLW